MKIILGEFFFFFDHRGIQFWETLHSFVIRNSDKKSHLLRELFGDIQNNFFLIKNIIKISTNGREIDYATISIIKPETTRSMLCIFIIMSLRVCI